jgi:hypothetical protein
MMGLRRSALLAVLLAGLLTLSSGDRFRSSDPPEAIAQLAASQDPFDQIVYAATVRGLAQQSGIEVCLHPDTPRDVGERILRDLPTYIPGIEPGMLGYNLRSRWTSTATNPSTGTTGNPITITWSIVPDGTDADGGPSDLYAVFNAAWGGTGWIDKIRNAFSKWQAVIGITYVEVSDDGSDLPDSPGALGVRGDVRISGRYIDGSGNVLAYDYYPNVGDMVVDTGDVAFYHSPLYNYGNLRNVIAHEHGHGIGLGHVSPYDCNKLMEPYICAASNFVGPQDDDIRGGMRDYGDIYENNDTNATPSILGTISDSLVVANLCIDNGQTDTDWFKVTLTNTQLTVKVDPFGASYYVGPDGGTEVWTATDSISDLDFDLYDAAGTTLIASATAGGLGATESLSTFVPTAGTYQIKVYRKAGSGSGVQRYTMSIYSDASAGVIVRPELSFSVYPSPFTASTTARFLAASAGPYRVDVYDVTGRCCRELAGRAPGAGWVEATWDGRNDEGNAVPAGVYFVRVSWADRVGTARVLVVR